MDRIKLPYVKPSLETLAVRSLTEAVGPVQAFASGAASQPNDTALSTMSGGNKTTRLSRR
jgi:hypothetical protein